MKSVEPIKDKAVVNDIIGYLKVKSDRDAMLFTFGIYSGLRISDIIKLRVRDVRGRDRITVKETKTGKDKIQAVIPNGESTAPSSKNRTKISAAITPTKAIK